MQLRDIEQMSYEEIAEATELKINAIRVNLSRARKKVRDEFLKINSNGQPKAGMKTTEFSGDVKTESHRVNGMKKN